MAREMSAIQMWAEVVLERGEHSEAEEPKMQGARLQRMVQGRRPSPIAADENSAERAVL